MSKKNDNPNDFANIGRSHKKDIIFRRENKQMDCGTIKQNNSANRHTKQYFALHNLFSHAVGRD